LVKVCGITDAEAASAAVGAGADFLGFVFYPPSPRHLAAEQAAEIAENVRDSAQIVAVFHHPAPQDVALVVEVLRPSWVQSDVDDFDAIRLPAGCRKLRVYRPATASRLEAGLELVLFEGPSSGRGRPVDWDLAREVAARCPVMLAGGLKASNVGEAIRAVGPAGVDVSSGVERAPGVKDPDKILDFVNAVRTAEERLR
jgi:phosphoribosylanthranilate isomerase